MMLASYQNLTPGQPYDCALASVPCASNMSRGFSDNPMTYWFDVTMAYGLMTFLSVMGIVGNIINMVIFSRHAIANDSTNTFLLCVSLVDMIIALNNTVFISTTFLCFLDASLAISAYNLVFLTAYRHIVWFPILGLDIVTVMAVQRATAVLLPFRVSKIFTNKNTNIIIAILFTFSILSLLPTYYASYETWVFHPYFEHYISLGNRYRIDFDTIYTYIDYYLSYRSILDLSILIISVSLTIIKLKLQSKSRMALKATTSSVTTKDDNNKAIMSLRERKMVRMSLAVCITTFILYSLPVLAHALSVRYFIHDMFKHPTAIMMFYTSMTLTSAMACFNFFLYLGMSKQYRDIFIQMFSCGSSSSAVESG